MRQRRLFDFSVLGLVAALFTSLFIWERQANSFDTDEPLLASSQSQAFVLMTTTGVTPPRPTQGGAGERVLQELLTGYEGGDAFLAAVANDPELATVLLELASAPDPRVRHELRRILNDLLRE